MRVILLQNVEGLGKQWDMKDVAAGYARNFLIPKNLAKPATKDAIAGAEIEKRKTISAAEEDLARWQGIASNIDSLELVIPVKVSEAGTLYSSVNEQIIADALRGLGHSVERSWVKLNVPLKELGEFPVTITFPHGLEAQVKIIIEEEKQPPKK